MIKTAIAIIAYFLFFLFILPDAFRFGECWHTFYWDGPWVSQRIADAGFKTLVDDFFTQFLATRWSASLMLSLGMALASWLLYSCVSKWDRRGWCFFAVLTVGMGGFSLWLSHQRAYQDVEGRFRNQMMLVHDGQWEEIIEQSSGRIVNNLLEQNLRNMALAETDQLDTRLMEQPCQNIYSIYVQDIQSLYVAAMLSDIYWSMGHVAFSQQYAFQTNEKMGNVSPRLLQRLADCAIIYGQYELAAKYLWWLDHTLFYRDWSRQRRVLLWDDEAVNAHPELGQLRRCLIAENRFSGSRGLDKDLQCIIDQCPEHRQTQQYLNALLKLYY